MGNLYRSRANAIRLAAEHFWQAAGATALADYRELMARTAVELETLADGLERSSATDRTAEGHLRAG